MSAITLGKYNTLNANYNNPVWIISANKVGYRKSLKFNDLELDCRDSKKGLQTSFCDCYC